MVQIFFLHSLITSKTPQYAIHEQSLYIAIICYGGREFWPWSNIWADSEWRVRHYGFCFKTMILAGVKTKKKIVTHDQDLDLNLI